MNPKTKSRLYSIHNAIYNLMARCGLRYDLKIYDAKFYDLNITEGTKMAIWFVPLLREIFQFKSLLDVGCGTGHYLRFCVDHGLSDVLGIEGSPHAFERLLVDKSQVVRHDLREPFRAGRKWDVALSIEVAEHIDKASAGTYVRTLATSSDTVVLTAARPGQGGRAHVNLQPPEWWQERFRQEHFEYDERLTERLKAGIRRARESGAFVTSWFEPNVMVFRNRGN